MKTGTVILIVFVVILSGIILFQWNQYEDANDNPAQEILEDLRLMSEDDVIVDPRFDSLSDVRVGYEVTGGVLRSYWYENSQYQIVMYHGATPETATIITSDTVTVTTAPTFTDTDWNVLFGGAYAPGNGALGFMVTNNNLGTTCMVWVWEA